MTTRPDRGRGTRSVFFVDDEPEILAAIRRSLMDEPYDIQTFLDPHEFLERVAAERPPVVVSDFYMPAMKGPEVLKKVSEIDPYIVRMILTGQPDLSAVVAATFDGGVHSFLIKPWDNEALCMEVRNGMYQHDILVERDATMARIKEAEMNEFRGLLRQNAQEHVANMKKRPQDE
jgi:response regulator RpfG family c-di-GMP phosphodiesterase